MPVHLLGTVVCKVMLGLLMVIFLLLVVIFSKKEKVSLILPGKIYDMGYVVPLQFSVCIEAGNEREI